MNRKQQQQQQQVPLESARTRHRKRVLRKERDITKCTKLKLHTTNVPIEIQTYHRTNANAHSINIRRIHRRNSHLVLDLKYQMNDVQNIMAKFSDNNHVYDRPNVIVDGLLICADQSTILDHILNGNCIYT